MIFDCYEKGEASEKPPLLYVCDLSVMQSWPFRTQPWSWG